MAGGVLTCRAARAHVPAAELRPLGHLGLHCAAVRAVAGVLQQGLRADADVADGHHDHLRAQLQHAAGAERDAELRPRGVLRARRILRDARDEPHRGRLARLADFAAAADRRVRRRAVRRDLRLPDDAQGGYAIRDDHARHRRDGVRRVADVSRILRRRRRDHGQPHRRSAVARHPVADIRPAGAGLLPDRALVHQLHGRRCSH